MIKTIKKPRPIATADYHVAIHGSRDINDGPFITIQVACGLQPKQADRLGQWLLDASAWVKAQEVRKK